MRDELTADGTTADYVNQESMSGWVLFRPRTETPQQFVSPQLEPAFFGESSASFGVTLSDMGFGLFRQTNGAGSKAPHVTAPLNEWHLGTFRWSAATSSLAVGLDGPPTNTVYASALTIPDDRAIHMFRSYDWQQYIDADLADFAIARDAWTDDVFQNAVAYVNDRYSLSLARTATYTPGTHTSCAVADTSSYVGNVITSAAPYKDRDGAKLHFFNGKYWLLGGWSEGYPEWDWNQTTNEVWSSADLANWTLELPHDSNPPITGAGARWRPRHTFGSVVWNGYLWVVGSDQIDSCRGDIWRSADGVTWERVLEEAPWGSKRMPVVGLYQGWLHVIGGEIDEPPLIGPASTQHYRTKDGVHWEQLPDVPFARSGIYRLVEHCGLLLVIGGNSGPEADRQLHNDTWAWDGTVWHQQSASAPWSPRMWIDVAEYDGKTWALAGRSLQGLIGDEGGAWYSTDAGVTWHEVSPPWGNTHADGVEATDADGIVYASGNRMQQGVVQLKASGSRAASFVTLSPTTANVAAAGSVTFAAAGGSGAGYTWSLPLNPSGATIDPTTGVYTAGSVGGVTDQVRVQDSLGNAVRGTVTVAPAAEPADAGSDAGADASASPVSDAGTSNVSTRTSSPSEGSAAPSTTAPAPASAAPTTAPATAATSTTAASESPPRRPHRDARSPATARARREAVRHSSGLALVLAALRQRKRATTTT